MKLCIWFNELLQVLIRNPIIFHTKWYTIQKQKFQNNKSLFIIQWTSTKSNEMQWNIIHCLKKYWKQLKTNAFLSNWWNSVYNWVNFYEIEWNLNHLPYKLMKAHKKTMAFSQTDSISNLIQLFYTESNENPWTNN